PVHEHPQRLVATTTSRTTHLSLPHGLTSTGRQLPAITNHWTSSLIHRTPEPDEEHDCNRRLRDLARDVVMAWFRRMGVDEVAYHEATIVSRADDHPGQALDYYGSRGE